MVIGEKMFSGAQESGKEGEGTVKMYGEAELQQQDGQRSGIWPDCAICKPRADITHQAPNPLSAFKFKSLTHKKTVLLVACVSSLESRS